MQLGVGLKGLEVTVDFVHALERRNVISYLVETVTLTVWVLATVIVLRLVFSLSDLDIT